MSAVRQVRQQKVLHLPDHQEERPDYPGHLGWMDLQGQDRQTASQRDTHIVKRTAGTAGWESCKHTPPPSPTTVRRESQLRSSAVTRFRPPIIFSHFYCSTVPFSIRHHKATIERFPFRFPRFPLPQAFAWRDIRYS